MYWIETHVLLNLQHILLIQMYHQRKCQLATWVILAPFSIVIRHDAYIYQLQLTQWGDSSSSAYCID